MLLTIVAFNLHSELLFCHYSEQFKLGFHWYSIYILANTDKLFIIFYVMT